MSSPTEFLVSESTVRILKRSLQRPHQTKRTAHFNYGGHHCAMLDSGQIVLPGWNVHTTAFERNATWKDPLLIPSYAASISAVILLGQFLYAVLRSSLRNTENKLEAEDALAGEPVGLRARFQKHVIDLGGPVIFAFGLARLVACLALVGLSSVIFGLFKEDGEDRQSPTNAHVAGINALHAALCAAYTYASCLSVLSVAGKPKWARIAKTHVSLVLLFPWGLFMYRDVWPLATFTLTPADAEEGWLIWSKVSLLTFAAAIVPLFSPRQYIPMDLDDAMPEPNPEQTSSILSMMLYNFCDPIVYKAARVSHLKAEELPPLSDRDYTKNLVKRSYPWLDPLQFGRKGHLARNLILGVFLFEHIEMTLMLIFRVITSFASPWGINRLLNYLETGGKDAVVRPWVWITWLFIGPVLGTIIFNWYHFLATRTYVQGQGILTQLVFDHALRIRVKAEVEDIPAAGGGTTGMPTPDNASVFEQGITTSNNAEPPEDVEEQSVTGSVATASAQGKTAAGSASAAQAPVQTAKPKSPESKGGNTIGKINNLITSDLTALQAGQSFLMLVFYVPVQIILSMFFLYGILGWSIFPGLAVMFILVPVPGYLAKLMQGVQVEKMKKSDARVQSVTETMNVIRMVKLFGWEGKMSQQLADKRQDELRFVRKFKLLELLNTNLNSLIPILTMVITYTTYTVIMKEELTASKVFASMAVFEIVQEHFSGTFYILALIIQAKVSLDRINEFLSKTELLDEYTPDATKITPAISQEEETQLPVGIRAASFTWATDNDGSMTSGLNRRNFTLRIDDEVFFKRGSLNLVIGPTGSGKTSLLMALLGEMHYIPLGPKSLVSLPRASGVAYHAQESWVLNETIRDNIIFGAPYDEKRYNAVIEQCALKRDLELFDAGDQTEVGEKGLTLSGGQKARVTLARAVYSCAEILLLDDVLAALDVHTARWIVEKCFQGSLLRGRTIILVTHSVALTAPIADFVVSLSRNGRILNQGSLSKILAIDKTLSVEIAKEIEAIEKAENEIDEQTTPDSIDKKTNGKLVMDEEISEGHVGWSASKLLLANMGGKSGVFVFWTLLLGFSFLCRVTSNLEVWVLGLWATQYEKHDSSPVSVSHYLSLYCGVTLVSLVSYSVGYTLYVFGTIRASRVIHNILVDSIFGATLRWLDKTPASRIIARCTQDIQTIDSSLVTFIFQLINLSLSMITKFFAVLAVSPIFAIPGFVLAGAGAMLGQIYMKAQLPVKRESSNAKSPVLGHFSAAVAGLVSIRAYGAQAAFKKESYARIDRYTRTNRVYWNLNRWIAVRTDVLGGLFASGLAAYLIYGGGVRASDTGFSLTMAVGFSSMLLWWVRTFNVVETKGNSLERIQHYIDIEHEPTPTVNGVPPAYWPASGDLKVDKLSARYSAEGPKVLHDISFHVKSGERVGIVGRTGSGKSSLTLALLRCIVTEGTVYYDGVKTDTINLDVLRSNITIIPQVPELLSGTLRQNLDPFLQYDDAVLNDALRAAGLFSLQKETDEVRITLDTAISGGGSNLSVGQRQILALARAIVRQSKLLILDEATSAIDYETDTVIQTSLRKELSKDTTLLTVAHRLQTIMDADKIMVLDAGHIVEFDTPNELLKNEKGMLRALVDESGDRDHLQAMAVAAAGSS